jgi:TonB family protein
MATVPDAADELRHEAQERAFRRNLLIVGGVHLVALGTFFLISKLQPKIARTELIWLDGGALGGNESAEAGELTAEPQSEPEPTATERIIEPKAVPPPSAPRPPSEIVLPTATPEPTPVRATPKPATPKPTTPKRETPRLETPRPKATPKTTPKTTPATTPKPTPKKAVSPKASASPAAAKSTSAETRDGSTSQAGPAMAKAGSGSNSGASKGAGKAAGSGAGTNEFAWYYEMLDDRFTSRWEQPLSIVRSAQQFVTTLKIRIDKDGSIVSREIANSSGNPVMDESVLAAARKVLVVDPLPAGLGGQTFDVKINFALDQGP